MEHICKNCGKPIKAAGEACTGCVGPDANDRATAQQEGTAERITLRGYVLILRHAEGSKSESYAPHLVVDSVKIHLLHVPGDNPFGPSSLSRFHGKYVGIGGEWDPRGRFLIVKECNIMEDPCPR